MVSVPWVLIKPSSQTTEMELPSWKLSPKRRALMGMPGSGHSLWPNAAVKGYKETRYDEEDIGDTYTRKVIQEYETEHLQATFYSSF